MKVGNVTVWRWQSIDIKLSYISGTVLLNIPSSDAVSIEIYQTSGSSVTRVATYDYIQLLKLA